MNDSTKKYYDELNIFRALVIIWVVIGHSFNNGTDFLAYLHFYAYSFHMKAFFLLSGLLFATGIKRIHGIKDAAKLTLKRAERLLIPYFFFTAVSYVLKLFLGEYANHELSQNIIVDALLGQNNPNGGLWFLYTLFWLSVLAILLHRLPAWANLIISIVLMLLHNHTMLLSHVIISSVSTYAVFFFLGLFLFEYYDKISNFFKRCFEKRKPLMTAFSFAMLAASFILVYFKFTNKIHFAYSGLTTAIFNIAVTYLLSYALPQMKAPKRFLTLIGNYGMDIYMIGYYVQITLRVVLMSMLGLPYLVYSGAMCILGLLLPIPISKYIVRKFRITRLLVLGDFSKKEVKNNGKKA